MTCYPPEKGKNHLGLQWEIRDVMEADPDRQRPPVVAGVYPCSPAHLAGLEPGDVLISVNERDARENPTFPPGGPDTAYRVEVLRGEESLKIGLVSAEVPDSMPRLVRQAPVGPPERWNCAERTFRR